MSTVIRVEDVSKQYRLGKIGTGSFTHDLNRWWHTIRGKDDPYLKVGETNDRTVKSIGEYVWALRNISFDVQRGDVIGIIGKNGAGKSTLLKLLSRTTLPTMGSIKIKGRIASLLEVGTGFHPELTGRENIFLNGAILGMTKIEIKRKFDEIVDFSGVEKYIDTPVKRYSSGMYVRLAFGVAAHLEQEILIVDEVLAVGDAEFQKKAVGKMREVSKNEGRTVLFVSHNIAAVKSLCKSGIFLSNGTLKGHGGILETINDYQNDISDNEGFRLASFYSKKDIDEFSISIMEAHLLNLHDEECSKISFDQDFKIRIKYKVNKELSGSIINFIISSQIQELYMSFDTDYSKDMFERRTVGIYETLVIIPARRLKQGVYNISIGTGIANKGRIEQINQCLRFEVTVEAENYLFASYYKDRIGIVPMVLEWKTQKS